MSTTPTPPESSLPPKAERQIVIPLTPVAPISADEASLRAKGHVLAMAQSQRLVVEGTIRRLEEDLGLVPTMTLLKRRALLRRIEWGGKANPTHFICPECGASQQVGHEKGCEMAILIAEEEK